MKLSDIKWDVGTIEIIQKKTEEFISLPMSNAIKWALLDYLTYARPKIADCENVFLRSHAPMVAYTSAGHFYKKVNKYFTTAGIKTQGKHHGMHSLRHSLATRMMRNDISITVISQALGHKYGNVTNKYIRIDVDQLRLASLEVPSDE
jgi:site-specific recombinase XerD